MNYKVFYILFFLLFFCRIDKIHADDEKTGQTKILELLGAAEKLSAVSNREALIFADSAMMLSQKINNVNYMMEALKIIVLTDLYTGDYDHCIETAEKLMVLGDDNNSDKHKMYANIGLGQANIMKDNYFAAKQYIDSAYLFAVRLENDSALCSVYNGLGLHAMNAEGNRYKAIEYYLQGIKSAEKSSNERVHSVLLCNLSGVYYTKRDPSGLRYAIECYQRGHKLNQSYLILIGATETAYFLYLEKNYDSALAYLNEAGQIMKEKNYLNQANIYNLYGLIYFDMKNYEAAANYFKKSLNESDQTQTSCISESYLGLGKIAMAEGKYLTALQYLKNGLDISTEKNNALNRRDLYYEISNCYEKMEHYMEALKTFKKFTVENDSIFNKDKEYLISDLMIKYETEQKENLLKEQNIVLITKEKHLQMQSGIIAIIIVACILMFVYYRRKNKRYLQIVRQNLYFVEQEKILRKTLAGTNVETKHDAEQNEEKENENTSVKYATSALSDEKSADLYLKIHCIMTDNKLYKDNSLTKERLAEMLDTNRTYLSQVINKHTGLSFTHYINRLRIEEVRRILSDPDDDTPLKALASDTGFNSLSTFYNVFQSIVGMPPSAYRAKMKKIYKERNDSMI